jgi:hypothetical protein
MTAENENERDSAFDSKRRLCPDDACVGVIGPGGKCSECGRTATGAPSTGEFNESVESVATESSDDDATVESTSSTSNDDGGFDPSRRLCSDDSCIGVIGDDRHCKVCGKPA